MKLPADWKEYAAEEYFEGTYQSAGVFDMPSQNFIVVRLSDVHERKEIAFLSIGRSGGDGIDFGYRKGLAGIWAYYPIEGEFKFMAHSINELVEKWRSGMLSV